MYVPMPAPAIAPIPAPMIVSVRLFRPPSSAPQQRAAAGAEQRASARAAQALLPGVRVRGARAGGEQQRGSASHDSEILHK
jgi:hypothetical protein